MTLDVAGQWATVLSPLVASGIFVATAVIERSRRARERYAAANDQARSELIRAMNWIGLPGTTHILSGGVTRSFHATTSFALCLPRRYSSVSVWLVTGATNMGVARHSRDRTDALKSVLLVIVALAPGNREALKAATEYVAAHPWADIPTGAPTLLKRLVTPVAALIRLITSDPTYYRSSEEGDRRQLA